MARPAYIAAFIVLNPLTFWHIPWVFDYAELHEQAHIAQHISFIVVGFMAVRSLGESFKLLALFALNGVMGFAGLMFSCFGCTNISSISSQQSQQCRNLYAGVMYYYFACSFTGLPNPPDYQFSPH
ncbi:MAG: DUF1404 domain-containing protein [Thermoproteota archaeon]|nr:DUF1404 domain-containing protein [Thermoproteota archaeon]